MSDQPSTPEPATTEPEDANTEPKADAPKPTETVDYWKNRSRENEKRAKDNADAAKRLAEIEDSQKSESEKVADRIAKAEAEVASVPAKVSDALKSYLVTLHEISDEDAELFLTASDPDLLLKQVGRLMERNADAGKPRPPRPDQAQGRSPSTTPLDPRAADLAQIEADIKAGSRR